MSWRSYALGFVAGTVLASYIALSCGTASSQSQEVATAISQAAQRHGVSERWMLAIARCESGYRPWVTSRGGHMGLYQYAARTWATFSRWAGWGGASPYDPVAASEVTAWALSRGYARHWSCA